MRAPKTVEVKLNLKIFEISGTWEPNDAERRAVWELYTELITRIAVVLLGPPEGLLREALDSLYSLFTSTRDILLRYGPEIAEPKPDGQYNFGYLSVAYLTSCCARSSRAGILPRGLGNQAPAHDISSK